MLIAVDFWQAAAIGWSGVKPIAGGGVTLLKIRSTPVPLAEFRPWTHSLKIAVLDRPSTMLARMMIGPVAAVIT